MPKSDTIDGQAKERNLFLKTLLERESITNKPIEPKDLKKRGRSSINISSP